MPDAFSTTARRRAALASLIEEAQGVLSSPDGQARFTDARWTDPMWSLVTERPSPYLVCFVSEKGGGNASAVARRLRERTVPAWPPTFADPLRAYLLVAPGQTYWTTRALMYSTRRFWAFLLASGRQQDAQPWTWDQLNDATLAAFNGYLRTAEPHGPGFGLQRAMHDVLNVRAIGWLLYERGACVPVTYTPLRAEREAREAAARASMVLPPEATGLTPGDADPRWAAAAAELVRAAQRRWENDADVRARWAPTPWECAVWMLRAGDAVNRTGGVLWSADFVPKDVPRTPEVLDAYGVTRYPASYGDPLRAFLLERPDLTPASVGTYVGLWKRFYRFLCDTGLSTVDAPWHWGMISDAQLLGFGAYLRAGLGASEGEPAAGRERDASARVMDLRNICDWLALRGAAPGLTVVRVDGKLQMQDRARGVSRGRKARVRAATAKSDTTVAAVRIAPPQAAPPQAAPPPALPPQLARAVEKGSARLATAALRERHPGAAWTDLAWQVVGRGGAATLVFGQLARRADAQNVLTPTSDAVEPWPPWYADPIRAMITERTAVGVLRLVSLFSVCRSFWRFLVAAKLHRPDKPWSWSRLDDRVLGRYEAYLQTRPGRDGQLLADASIRGALDTMLSIGRWLASHRVVRTPTYVPITAAASARWRDDEEQRRAGAALLPPRGSLEALAMLYYEVTQGALRGKLSPVNEACVLILVLLMMTGRRLGEVVRLRADCLLYETVRPWRDGWAATEGVRSTTRPAVVAPDQRVVLRMRYWMEKKQADREGVIGVMPTAAPIVEACIARLLELTAAPRSRAAELERTPDHFPLPEALAVKAYLTLSDILTIYPSRQRLSDDGHGVVPAALRRTGLRIARYLRSGGLFFPADVAAAMQAVRRRVCPQDVVVRPVSGEPQMLSDTLLVTYYREGRGAAGPVPALVQRLSQARVSMRIGGAASPLWREVRRHAPALEVKGLKSHGFRRWLNSVGLHGGAPIAVLTRYFGRDHDEQTKAYIYPVDMLDLPLQALSQDARARAEHLKQEIKAGRVFASVALGYFRVKAVHGETEADAYLERNLPAAHPTEVGHCSRDLALEPCHKHLNCLDGCEHYMGTKGDAREIRALSDLAERLAQEGDMLRAQVAAGARIHVDRLPRSERQLAEVRRLLYWHHDPSIPDGTSITKDGPAPRRLRVLT